MRKLLDFTKFFIISVPLACLLYCSGQLYYEIKRLFNQKQDKCQN